MMEGKSPAYILGVIVGFVVAFLLVLILKRLLIANNGKREYDERQKLAIAKGYKIGYFTLLIYFAVVAVFDVLTGIEWCSLYTCTFIGMLLSIGVFGIVCIGNDAYLPLKQSPKRYIAMFLALGGINLAIGIIRYACGVAIVQDGMLAESIINPLVGVLLLALSAALAVKVHKDRQEQEAE